MSWKLVIIAAQVLTGLLSVGAFLAEMVLNVSGRRRDYSFGDTVANFCTAVVYGAFGGLALLCIVPVYELIRSHFGLFQIEPANAFAWVAGFVCADFCHYWFHRCAHRNNFMWGIHQGHHSSEEFNLGIAVRKGIFQQWVDWPFFLPMALLGYPVFMYLPLKTAQFVYQFWVHNQFIGKLGWIEQLLVTPSLHRVHHGQNPQYIDKNYAGVFILWDRLFGSYEREEEPVVYGIGTPVRTFNPLRMQFIYWAQLWRDARASSNRWDLWRIWFMPTGWRPQSRRATPWPDKIHDCHAYEKYQRRLDRRTKLYVMSQLLVLGLLTALVSRESDQGTVAMVGSVLGLVFVLWTSWAIGQWLDQRGHSRRAEVIRLALLAALAAAAVALQPGVTRVASMLLGTAVVGIVLTWFVRVTPQRVESELAAPVVPAR